MEWNWSSHDEERAIYTFQGHSSMRMEEPYLDSQGLLFAGDIEGYIGLSTEVALSYFLLLTRSPTQGGSTWNLKSSSMPFSYYFLTWEVEVGGRRERTFPPANAFPRWLQWLFLGQGWSQDLRTQPRSPRQCGRNPITWASTAAHQTLYEQEAGARSLSQVFWWRSTPKNSEVGCEHCAGILTARLNTKPTLFITEKKFTQ